MNESCPPEDAHGSEVPPDRAERGFTLIELLAAVAIFAIILLVIFGLTQQAGNAWRSTTSKIEAFQEARLAFDTIAEKLSQATLNPYYDYLNSAGNSRTAALAAGNASTFVPANYGRTSDLHFLTGKSLLPAQIGHSMFFQTPSGFSSSTSYQQMDTLLNAVGFYVQFDKDSGRPAFLDSVPGTSSAKYRYRLYEFLQPSEQLSVYASGTGNGWFSTAALNAANRSQLAANVIALLILPKPATQDASAPMASDFEYDTRDSSKADNYNQLPPLVEVVLVAIDENSARRLESGATAPDLGVSALFQQADQLDADLHKLEELLASKRINYRIFRTTVPLRGAKWSN